MCLVLHTNNSWKLMRHGDAVLFYQNQILPTLKQKNSKLTKFLMSPVTAAFNEAENEKEDDKPEKDEKEIHIKPVESDHVTPGDPTD
jgi:hypothetical protein